MLNNKKGASAGISKIITFILGVIVLSVIIFFSGGVSKYISAEALPFISEKSDETIEDARSLISSIGEDNYVGPTTVEGFTLSPSTQGSSQMSSNYVQTAYQEHERWNRGQLKETERQARPLLTQYWSNAASDFPQDNIDPAHYIDTRVFWSAAFISYVVPDIKGYGHWQYINQIHNRQLPGWNFYRLSQTQPQVGDIVCGTRSGSRFNPSTHYPSHCDIIVSVNEDSSFIAIGGNIGDTVAMLTVTNINSRYDIGILRKVN